MSDLFQPTRPLRGATEGVETLKLSMMDFNPRAPCGARHVLRPLLGVRLGISTHAPLAGRDGIGAQSLRRRAEFQPTRPLRGATV